MDYTTKSWATGLLGAIVVACGSHDGERLYVMTERYEVNPEYDVGPLTGCTMAVYEGNEVGASTFAGGPPGRQDDFVIEDYTEGAGLLVTVRSQDMVLETRDYDVEFARSGDVDGFRVTTLAGHVFELAFWGGPTCETSRHVIAVPDASPDVTLKE